MGTLHEIYQLRPKALSDGAILPVKKKKRRLFLEQYAGKSDSKKEEWGLFSNTFAINSAEGKVHRIAIYSSTRILDFGESGIYIAIQSGSKYGFDSTFEEKLQSLAPFLEDALFYVIWDNIRTRFEVKDGTLSFQKEKDFDQWDYSFEKYLTSNYVQYPQIVADFYVDQIIEMKLRLEDLVANDEDPRLYYDVEEYEEVLNNLNSYEAYIPVKVLNDLKGWLKEQFILQKDWEEKYYD
jgi:hypothetical protein